MEKSTEDKEVPLDIATAIFTSHNRMSEKREFEVSVVGAAA